MEVRPSFKGSPYLGGCQLIVLGCTYKSMKIILRFVAIIVYCFIQYTIKTHKYVGILQRPDGQLQIFNNNIADSITQHCGFVLVYDGLYSLPHLCIYAEYAMLGGSHIMIHHKFIQECSITCHLVHSYLFLFIVALRSLLILTCYDTPYTQ